MEIRIDPNMENISDLKKLMSILKKKIDERKAPEKVKTRRKNTQKRKEEFTGAEYYQISKYGYYLDITLLELANRTVLDSIAFLEVSEAEREKMRKSAKEELLIDQKTLVKEFIKVANLPEIEPRPLKEALRRLKDSRRDLGSGFYVEGLEINGHEFFRVIF